MIGFADRPKRPDRLGVEHGLDPGLTDIEGDVGTCVVGADADDPDARDDKQARQWVERFAAATDADVVALKV